MFHRNEVKIEKRKREKGEKEEKKMKKKKRGTVDQKGLAVKN